ncbi:MAG: beta-ketoacyl-[acyl-carrier-protein] synthase family protein [Anaerolineae bacterium]
MPLPQRTGRRVVVTGMGILSPIGSTPALFWDSLLQGRCGVRPIEAWPTEGFPSRFAGIIDDFDALAFMDRQLERRTDRFAQFGLVVARTAVNDGRLDTDKLDRDCCGVSIGTAVAGLGVIERESQVLVQSGPRRVNPMVIPSVIGNMAACLAAIDLGFTGPALCPTGACATGCMGIGEALLYIRSGVTDVMVAGGSESVNTQLAVASFGRLGALSRRNDDASLVCRPFDVDRDGTVLAEGAAALLLETEDHATARGATILAELAGYGVSCDAYHIAAPDPNGTGAAKAMRAALAMAHLKPEEVSYVCAHGTGTPLNDISEARAIREVLRDAADTVPVSSIKFAMGHALGAAGALSAVTAVQAIGHGIVPGTLNLRQQDPECRVNAIATNVQTDVQAVLVNAFGFGGQNASLVFRRW